MKTSDIIKKLYLNQVEEVSNYRRNLNPIRPKHTSLSPTNQLRASRSVSDIFKNLNGSVIIQNWNTKNNIPKDIGELLNLPSLIDQNKYKNSQLLQPEKPKNSSEKLSLLEKIKLSNLKKNNFNNKLLIDINPLSPKVNKLNNLSFLYNRNRNIKRNNSSFSYKSFDFKIEEEKKESLIKIDEENKNEANNNKNINNELVPIKKTTFFKYKKLKIKKIKNDEKPIDFSTFKQYLFLRDNDFLYAKRVGSPVDFAFCTFKDINNQLKFNNNLSSSIHNPSKYKNKCVEYITISKNTIVHYQKGIPKLFTIEEWKDIYIKFKKLLNIPLFKNFKNACLFDLWKRYYRKKKRTIYTEKLKKKAFFIDKNLLSGVFGIRRILKEMSIYDLFKLNIPSPIYLNNFSQLYLESFEKNNKSMEDYRNRIKRRLNTACEKSYKDFRIAKNISLDESDNDEEEQEKNNNNVDNSKVKKLNNILDKVNSNKKTDKENYLKFFLKDAIPYAQDATRKKHFKRLLKFIRLIDILYNNAKFDLIIYSLTLLDKKFSRLYEAYLNNYKDTPIIITTIVPLNNKISYNPSMDSVKSAIFDHFIEENVYAVIYQKSFLDPKEFPKYMIVFEEVFDVSVDQNGIFNGRIKDDDQFNELNDNIKSVFDKCRDALEKTIKDLIPVLNTYNKFMKINFRQLEKDATHIELNKLISDFKTEDTTVKKLQKKINIGIFEFRLDLLLEEVTVAPVMLLSKIYATIPKILLRKIDELTENLDNYNNLININVNSGDVEAFIKLKKAVDKCSEKRNFIEKEMDEIYELNNIINNNSKEIKLEDYDKRKYAHLIDLRTCYERKLDSMMYFIEQNIKTYHNELMIKIKKYDEMLKRIYRDLNDEIINKYSDNTVQPLLLLEEKGFIIKKAINTKNIFQRQELDIEMNENDRSNFENLDLVTYEYELKTKIWNNLHDYQEISMEWDKNQILEINVNETEKILGEWKNNCIIGIKDLNNCEVAEKFLYKIQVYEKITRILKIIQNPNIQNVKYLRDELQSIITINNMEFTNSNFLVEKILTIKGLNAQIPRMEELNFRANEEKRLREVYEKLFNKFSKHQLPLTLITDNEKGISRYSINLEDFDIEQEFLESLLSSLNKEMSNKYINVIIKEFGALINKVNKYKLFLDIFYDYQVYLQKIGNIIYNQDFAKEFPSEFKKIISDFVNKSIVKSLKESPTLGKYIDYAHERVITNLKTLINNYDNNYKAIQLFLFRRRKENQDYFLLNDNELLELIETKDSFEVRQKLLYKIYPYIKYVNPGRENDDTLHIIAKNSEEELNFRYTKATKTLSDAIECFEVGVNKKIRENFRMFKKEFELSLKPKKPRYPKDIINEMLKEVGNKNVGEKNKNNLSHSYLYQTIFICFYHVIYYLLEKTLEKESTAFDKLFDFYNEVKDDWKGKYINMIKNNENSPFKMKLLICFISVLEYFIKNIECLLRDDVRKNTEYSFLKILLIKIENDSANIRLFNINLEYGNEYIGLKYDFINIPQTELTFLCILNTLYLRKSFVLFNNQKVLRKHTISIVSNIIGRRVNYFSLSNNFKIESINTIIYGYSKKGQFICINNLENLQINILQMLLDRINEIFRLLRSKSEEDIFTDRDGEKYFINFKKFNIFMTYGIDDVNVDNKSVVLPYTIKYNYRVIGINHINYFLYMKNFLRVCAINRFDEISNKIEFIFQNLICKCEYFYKNKDSYEKAVPLIFYKLKKKLIFIRKYIDKSGVYEVIKKCLLEIISPFLKDNEKELFESFINIILFNYDEKAQQTSLKKLKSTGKNFNLNENNKEELSENDESNEKCYDEILSKFCFGNTNYKNKIKFLYESFKNFQSFIILGTSLGGKTNLLVSLRDISLKLNELNEESYPIFSYIKIYPNSKKYEDIFINNKIKINYQINNIFFNCILDILIKGGNLLEDIDKRYKEMLFRQYIEKKSNNNIEKILEDRDKDKENLINDKNDELNNTYDYKKYKTGEIEINSEKEKENKTLNKKYDTIVFDGSISPYWYQYLIFYNDNKNIFTFSNGDFLNLSKIKFIYETTSLSNVCPSFIINQNIISLDSQCFNWLNIAYVFAEENKKINKNEILKNYIKGLFENYGEKIIDFILANKLKNISYCINPSFIVKNIINLFDAFLPDFDFSEKILGRRKSNYIPKIEIIKKQTLTIFIFCSSWVMNLLTDFLIRNKIEKTVSDLFKSDELKGPIFDYYLDEKNLSYNLLTDLIKNEKYLPPIIEKNKIFYFGNNYITTLENLPFQIIINKLLISQSPILLIGKACCGKTLLINNCLEDLTKSKEIKYIKMINTFKNDVDNIEYRINKNMDIISRNVLGDKYLRKVVFSIDDVHLSQNSNNFYEYMRYLLNNKYTYNDKYNYMKYYKDFNLVNIGNFCNTIIQNHKNENSQEFCDFNEYLNYKNDFIRYVNQFSIVCLNFEKNNYFTIYKTILENYMKIYIPNTSNITSSQYINVLFALNKFLKEEINFDYDKLHYSINYRNITKIVQRFNMVLFNGGNNDFPDYIKKLFFYETYCLYTDKINSDKDIKIFENCLIKAFNNYFKQEKIDKNIFKSLNSYMFLKNFLQLQKLQEDETENNNKIHPKDLEYVYIENTKDLQKYILYKIKNFFSESFYNSGAKGTEDNIYNFELGNNLMVNNIIKILRLLNNENPNLILIGKDYCAKELLAKIALSIMKYNYVDINIDKLLNKNKKGFEEEIKEILKDIICNEKKIFLMFKHELFNEINIENDDKTYILEIISILLSPVEILNKFDFSEVIENIKKLKKDFTHKENDEKYKINIIQDNTIINKEYQDILLLLKRNLNVIISINKNDFIYRELFLNYPHIVNNSETLIIQEYTENNLYAISNVIFDKQNNLMTNNLTNILKEIFNYSKYLYEESLQKINIDIIINQRHFMQILQYITTIYKKYHLILEKNAKNYEQIFENLKICGEVIEKNEKLLENLCPEHEKIDKKIEELKKQMNNQILEKNKIKSKKLDEEKIISNIMKIYTEKNNTLIGIFKHRKDSIKKSLSIISKLTDKDLLDCKNTWENFPLGKFILMKIFEFINDDNYGDFDYIKKNISNKQIKKFTNIDFISPKNKLKYSESVAKIVSNVDFSTGDKFNKPYKLANTFCDYFNKINVFYKLYDENIGLIKEVEEMTLKIDSHRKIIKQCLEEFKIIDKQTAEIDNQIAINENTKNNTQNKIHKIKNLINEYKTYAQMTENKKEMFLEKQKFNTFIIKNFDFCIIYIVIYLHCAPILNNNQRKKLKSFLNQLLEKFNKNNNDNLEIGKEKNIKDIDFLDLIYVFSDINTNDKVLYMNCAQFDSKFIIENLIFMHIFNKKVPLIIDYTQYSKDIITEYLRFERSQEIHSVSFNKNGHQNNDFHEKLEKNLKLGWALFVENIESINKIYFYFYNYINHHYIGTNVKIGNNNYEFNENFKLFLFKDIYGKEKTLIDDNIWFNVLFINFNLNEEDIKDRIFSEISIKRNEDAFNNLKKIKKDSIKQNLKKLDTEKKMINSIIQIDLSGNIEKLPNVEIHNEKYKRLYQLYTECENSIESLKKKSRKQKIGLDENYDKLCEDSAKIFKWIFKLNIFENIFSINPKSLFVFLLEYFNEKITIKNKGHNIEQYNSNDKIIKSKSSEDIEDSSYEIPDDEKESQKNFNEIIVSVDTELFIYNSEDDSNSLLIFFYNKLNGIYFKKNLRDSLLLLFGFISVSIKNKIFISFRKYFINCYKYEKEFDKYFDKNQIILSPIKNITSVQWTILNKLNILSGDLISGLLESIKNNQKNWDFYLEEIDKNPNNYYNKNFNLTDENVKINELLKFIFYYIIKPTKREFLIQTFIKENLLNNENNEVEINFSNIEYNSVYIKKNIENFDLIKAFKNFNPQKEYALVLITENNSTNIYDKILYEYCYLKMFNANVQSTSLNNNTLNQYNKGSSVNVNSSFRETGHIRSEQSLNVTSSNLGVNSQYMNSVSMSDVKYKEIILDEHNNDISQQDLEYIKNNIKSGGVIIIKNAQLISLEFNEIINEISEMRYEDISPNFKLILICDINEKIKNEKIYENCRFIYDNLIYEGEISSQSVKENVLNIIKKIPNNVFTFILNNQNYFLRLFLRKLIYFYIAFFGIIQSIKLDNNPFIITRKDFYNMCKFIMIYLDIENFTEEKYNEFINMDNSEGYNYIAFILVMNNIFICSKQIYNDTEYNINKLIGDKLNFKTFNNSEYYLDLENIKIPVCDKPIHEDLRYEDIYETFDQFTSENYQKLLPDYLNLKKDYKFNENVFKNIVDLFTSNKMIEEIDISIDDDNSLDMNKIYNYLLKLEESIPKNISYKLNEFLMMNLNEDEGDIINQSLFKKNRYGLYFNQLDESLLYEIELFNDKSTIFHEELHISFSMLNQHLSFDTSYYNLFQILNKNLLPPQLNINNNENKNYEELPNISSYINKINKKISIFKQWVKNGNLEYYHLGLFDNLDLFINSLKIYFCKKYYGDNNYSNITPEMINLKFISTDYKTYEELSIAKEKSLDFYTNTYNNDLIWISGLYLINASVDNSNKYIFFDKKNIKQKLNLVAVIYSVIENKKDQYIDSSEIDENESEKNDENETTNQNNSIGKSTKNNFKNTEDGGEENEEGKEENDLKNQKSVKVNIYRKNEISKFNFYQEKSIGYIKFYLDDKTDVDQNYIVENEIKIIVGDLDEISSKGKM